MQFAMKLFLAAPERCAALKQFWYAPVIRL
jgi:hypothetical protein